MAHLHPNRSADQELGCFLIDVSPRTDALLRVAAGYGMFGIGIGKTVPQAEIVAVDWEPVLGLSPQQTDRSILPS